MTTSFDRIADTYDATRGFPQGVAGRIVAAVCQQLPSIREARVLEIGVGTGRLALPFSAQVTGFIGLDISQKMLCQLQSKVTQGSSLEVMIGDAHHLPFSESTFDAVLCVSVLHLLPDWGQVLGEIRRILRKGGLLLHGRTLYQGLDSGLYERLRYGFFRDSHASRSKPRDRGLGFEEAPGVLRSYFSEPYEISTVSWDTGFSGQGILHQFKSRVWSETWALSDEELADFVRRMSDWVVEQVGDPMQTYWRRSHFVVSAYPNMGTR